MSFTPGRSDGEYFTWDRFYLYHEQDLEKISQRSMKKTWPLRSPKLIIICTNHLLKKGENPICLNKLSFLSFQITEKQHGLYITSKRRMRNDYRIHYSYSDNKCSV